MTKVPSDDIKTIIDPFRDEFEPKGDRYVEKFQEVLYAHHEPTPQLLDSLEEQPKTTLEKLKNILQITHEHAEPEHKRKFELALQAIEGLLKA